MNRSLGILLGLGLVATPALAQQPTSAKPAPAAPDTAGAAPAERIGGADARVVIEEYADFQCPYCAAHEMQFGDSVLSWVRGQKGTVRFDFYDVALRQHAAAAPAAHAARCAGDQNRYDAARHPSSPRSRTGAKPGTRPSASPASRGGRFRTRRPSTAAWRQMRPGSTASWARTSPAGARWASPARPPSSSGPVNAAPRSWTRYRPTPSPKS